MIEKLKNFWEKGYLHISIAAAFFALFCRPDRVGVYDWSKEVFFFQYIKLSFTGFGSLPFFWWERSDLLGYPTIIETAYFISNPESFIFSPFSLLLPFLNAVVAIKLMFIVHFGIGVWGAFKLKKALNWSDAQFRIFAGLFFLSPIILQHLAVGYFPWMNLFFFPWFFYLIAQSNMRVRVLGLAVIFGLTTLQGGTHPLVWFVFLYGLYTLFAALHRRSLRMPAELLLAGMGTALLSLVRLSLTFQVFSDFQHGVTNGYNLSQFLKWGLIPTHFPEYTPHYAEEFINGIGFWDGGTYWGISLLLFLFLFAFLPGKYRQEQQAPGPDNIAFLLAALVLFVLSFYHLYETLIDTILSVLPIPFLSGAESYPFRFTIPAFFGFTFVAAQWFPAVWKRLGMEKPVESFYSLPLWGRIGSLLSALYSRLVEKTRRAAALLKRLWELLLPVSSALLVMLIAVLLASFLFKSLLWEPFRTVLQAAYEGSDSRLGLLTESMSGRDLIPFETYLNKAEMRYRDTQRLLLQISFLIAAAISLEQNLLCSIRWLQERWREIREHFLQPHTSAFLLVETLLLLPLAYSTLMWALLGSSNPAEGMRALGYEVYPPVVEVAPDSVALEIRYAPDELLFSSNEPLDGVQVTLPEIPARDGNFLLNSSNLIRVEADEALAFRITGGNEARVSVDKRPFWITGGITLLMWAAAVVLLVKNDTIYS